MGRKKERDEESAWNSQGSEGRWRGLKEQEVGTGQESSAQWEEHVQVGVQGGVSGPFQCPGSLEVLQGGKHFRPKEGL